MHLYQSACIGKDRRLATTPERPSLADPGSGEGDRLRSAETLAEGIGWLPGLLEKDEGV